MNWFGDMGWSVSQFFSSGWERASLAMALLSSWIVVVICGYLGRLTQRQSFALWTGAWSFFSVYLVTLLVADYSPDNRLLQTGQLGAGGLCAAFLLLGGMKIGANELTRAQIFALAAAGLLAGLAAQAMPPEVGGMAVLTLLAVAGMWVGWRFGLNVDRPSRLLASAHVLWGAILFLSPWLFLLPASKTVALVGLTGLALIISICLLAREQETQMEQRYRDVVDAANTGIFVVDLWSLEILEANRTAQRLVKRDLPTLRRMRFGELCPDLQRPASNLLDHRAMFNTVFKPYNEVNLTRNGDMVLCEGETHLIQWRSRPALQINIREVDHGKKVGQMVRRAEKMSSLGQLVAGVAHEINNPLAVIVAYSQMLVKQPAHDDKTRQTLQKVLHESERAAKIVRDLLTFARPCEPQLRVVDLNELVRSVISIRESELRSQNIECKMTLARDLPLTKADPLQLEQVLNNLVTNAIHAMVELNQERKLAVTSESTGFYIRVTVADSGPGISPENISRIFDPFFTTKAPGKGTGLGLSISNTILQEHRGKIWAQSELGKGAKFHVELPVIACELEEPETGDIATTADGPKEPPSGGQRILVVDDEPGIRDVLGEILGGLGYGVDTAGSGMEALAAVKEQTYDLIISDLAMPGMDGEKLYQVLRDEHPELARRIVFLTGDTVSVNTRQFLERTGNRWLTKPFNISDVEHAVSDMLKNDPLRRLTDAAKPRPTPRYHPGSS